MSTRIASGQGQRSISGSPAAAEPAHAAAPGEGDEAEPRAGGPHPGQPKHRYASLFRRIATVNALVVVAAVIATTAVLARHRLSSLAVDEEIAVLVVALAAIVAVNLYLLRRVIRPLQALTALARRVDLMDPGQRLPNAQPNSEAGELALTFNEMLDRLEAERHEATGRVLAAQEAERLRIARELHDQVGQDLTAVLLMLSRIRGRAGAELEPQLHDAQESVRTSLEDVRQIATELRPQALDDLGLLSALAMLGSRISERSGIEVTERVAEDLPPLAPEVELAIYRVAQEALTNVVRHSGAHEAELALVAGEGAVTLTVRDRGRGMPAGRPMGSGIRGMRERAALIGAKLKVARNEGGAGCEVRLEVPLAMQR